MPRICRRADKGTVRNVHVLARRLRTICIFGHEVGCDVSSKLRHWGLVNHDSRVVGDAFVEIDDVMVDQAYAA